MNLKDFKPTIEPFKLIQTGEPGSGKSVRAVSAVRFGRVLILDTDRKFLGLVPRLFKLYGEEIIRNNVDVEVIKSSEEFESVVKRLPELIKTVSTVVLDTQSRVYDYVLEGVRRLNPKGDGRQIFGAAVQKNGEILNTLLSLPRNVVINTHVGMEDMEDGTKKLTSTTPGKFGKTMPEHVNEVHYCYLNLENKHTVRGEPSSSVVARTVRPSELLTPQGTFKVNDLSIFDDSAFRL